MAFRLATTADLKTLLKFTGSAEDSLLDLIGNIVGAQVERYLGRELENTGSDRVEYHSADGLARVFPLLRYPVLSSPALVVKVDPDREFGASTVIETTEYAIWDDQGLVEFETPPEPGIRNVQVTYRGGYTASSGTLASIPEPIRAAALAQAAAFYQRRESLGISSSSDPVTGAIVAFGTGSPLDLLEPVKRLLEPYRRRAVA